MELLERASKRKETAMLILEELELLEKWNTIGQSYVGGTRKLCFARKRSVSNKALSRNGIHPHVLEMSI